MWFSSIGRSETVRGEPELAPEVLATSEPWDLLGMMPEGFPQHGRSI